MTLNFNISDIDLVAQRVLKSLRSKTVLFYGNMGVGKTTFINAMVNALGGQEDVSSPTFSLVNEYKVTNDIVFHFDFYRINSIEEALDMGVEDYFYSGKWNFIEWPEKVNRILPIKTDELELKVLKNKERCLNLQVFE